MSTEPSQTGIAPVSRLLFDKSDMDRPSDKDDDLRRLAVTMIEPAGDLRAPVEPVFPGGNWTARDNPDIWAGYTYLGQFIGHDVTFDPSAPRAQGPGLDPWLRPVRAFNLDSLYGGGPGTTSRIYDKDGATLLLGAATDGKSDLCRDKGQACIPEARNDENAIVAQIHLAFARFHNRVATHIRDSKKASGSDLFVPASDVVRRHYQWIVLHDFLPRLIGYRALGEILDNGRFLPVGGTPASRGWRSGLRFPFQSRDNFLPLEFSAAAFRVGHSMVRPRYVMNAKISDGIPIFDTGADDLRGSRPLSEERRIEWRRFFPLEPTREFQVARAIDTNLTNALGAVPKEVSGGRGGSLAEMNLMRGKALNLPSGQAVARAMGVPDEEIITLDNRAYPFQIGAVGTSRSLRAKAASRAARADMRHLEGLFGDATPLWYYVLKEAELFRAGRGLGPVGGRIVAEVAVALLSTPNSILDPGAPWAPTPGEFGCRREQYFTMADLIRYAQA